MSHVASSWVMLSSLIIASFRLSTLHELATGPATVRLEESDLCVFLRNVKSAFTVIAHHRRWIPLRKKGDIMALAEKTAAGLRKGIWVSGDKQDHMERAKIARHTFRIMDDVSCFMLLRSHQETWLGEIKRRAYSKSDCCGV